MMHICLMVSSYSHITFITIQVKFNKKKVENYNKKCTYIESFCFLCREENPIKSTNNYGNCQDLIKKNVPLNASEFSHF